MVTALDQISLEQIQRRATKYILNICFIARLIKLKLLPLMYLFELQDILLAVKSIKTPTEQFSLTNYIEFSSSNNRSGGSNKLLHSHHLNNTSHHPYFHQLPSLWNAMPVIDLNLSWKLKAYRWNHFISNFNDDI